MASQIRFSLVKHLSNPITNSTLSRGKIAPYGEFCPLFIQTGDKTMSNAKTNNPEKHIEWLDRQLKHDNGYPKFMSEPGIAWLQDRIMEYRIQCDAEDRTPSLEEAVNYWTQQDDVPYDLFFLFKDGLYGITHKALLGIKRVNLVVPSLVWGEPPNVSMKVLGEPIMVSLPNKRGTHYASANQ